MRKHLDVSAYLVVGPENTLGRPVPEIVGQAVAAGFTCVQLRSKTATAREMIALCRETAAVLARLGRADAVALLVDDRLLMREHLGLTVLFDHDVTDGAPVARFVARLQELMESAYGLVPSSG